MSRWNLNPGCYILQLVCCYLPRICVSGEYFMRSIRQVFIILICLFGLVFLFGCTTRTATETIAAPTPANAAAENTIPAAAPSDTPAPTTVPTSTPVPTNVPTPTPTPTPTPAPEYIEPL